jgi:hypothetical protein
MSLADIRAKLQAQENRTQQNTTPTDNAIYPFWNMIDGTTSVVRFLPDGDSTNSFFWVERAMIKLPFSGIKGQNETKQVLVQVPCMEMYGESCPVLAEVRTWYKDESLKETANKYWKKRTYLFQGFVRTNPMQDDKTPENPIRRFVISPQIFAIIKSSLMDPEIEELPTDFLRGLDFRIVKGKKGDYADYSTSGWARKESALTEVEQAAIDAHGLFNLKDYLPKKPSESEARIIKDMFEASVDGRAYDPDKWGAYYKPWGLQNSGSSSDDMDEDGNRQSRSTSSTVPSSKITKMTTSVETSAPWEETETPTASSVKVPTAPSGDKAQDILAMIRQRQNKTA